MAREPASPVKVATAQGIPLFILVFVKVRSLEWGSVGNERKGLPRGVEGVAVSTR
jgi:hypothetical protein